LAGGGIHTDEKSGRGLDDLVKRFATRSPLPAQEAYTRKLEGAQQTERGKKRVQEGPDEISFLRGAKLQGGEGRIAGDTHLNFYGGGRGFRRGRGKARHGRYGMGRGSRRDMIVSGSACG